MAEGETAGPLFESAVAFFRTVQTEIIAGLESAESDLSACAGDSGRAPARFVQDAWQRTEATGSIHSGGGLTCVLSAGRIFERAGVNFSDVAGRFSEEMAGALPGTSRDFRASGVSLVLHPRNPHVPTVHANFRAIRRGSPENPERLWFGGGADLTPYVLYEDDAVHFHRTWRAVCESHATVADYRKMKSDCDAYFFLPHRGEARGIGGIFFDYLEGEGEAALAFVRSAGRAFLDSYLPIVERRAAGDYSESERRFQLLRRGRYVEFNLVYDRGTQFGLKTGGRTESILMSLPPEVHWSYNYEPEPGSGEAELLAVLRKPKDWI